MSKQPITHLIHEPAQGYRAIINGCQDAILVAPNGDIIATYTHMEDAMHTADVLNARHENANALACAATFLDRLVQDMHEHQAGLRHRSLTHLAMMAINNAPARKVIKAGNGVGQS